MSFAIVFFVRPNLAAVWVVFEIYIFIDLIRKKRIKEIINFILINICAIALVVIPIFIYFYTNSALKEFINTYFIFNINYSAIKEVSLIKALLYYIEKTYGLVIFPIICTVFFFFNKNIKEKKLLMLNIIYYLLSLVLIISPGRKYFHYVISIIPSICISFAIVFKYIKINYKIIYTICIVLVIIYTLVLIINIKQTQTNMEYYKLMIYLEKFINENTSDQDCILQIGNETQIYTLDQMVLSRVNQCGD